MFAQIRSSVSADWYKFPPRIRTVLKLSAVLAMLAGGFLLAAPPTTVHPTTSGKPSQPVGSKTSPVGGPTVTITAGPFPSEALRKVDECVSQPLPVITLARPGERTGTVELAIGAVAVCVGVYDEP